MSTFIVLLPMFFGLAACVLLNLIHCEEYEEWRKSGYFSDSA